MKNMRRWKRLLAVGMCSAMMFSMSVGVSATENQDTEETNVEETKEEEEAATEDETALKGDSGASGNVNDKLSQVGGEVSEEAEKKAAEPGPIAEVAGTEENSDDLPIVERKLEEGKDYRVIKSKGDLIGYEVVLSEEWKLITVYDSGKEPSNYKRYVNGVLMGSGPVYSGLGESLDPKDLTGEPLEITYEIDKLEHYSDGKADYIVPNVRISFKTEVEESEGGAYACMLPTVLDYDGSQDLVFRFKNGTGDHAIEDITNVYFYADSGSTCWTGQDFTYDIDAGTLTVRHLVINNLLNSTTSVYAKDYFYVWMEYTDKSGVQHEGDVDTTLWKVNYLANEWGAVGEKPEFIKTSHTFDGTEDMVFNFKNGTGDNAIASIEQVFFNVKEVNNTDENGNCLTYFFIGNYGVSFDYDIEKGQVTLFKHAVSALVHSDRSDWEAVGNVYGDVWMTVKLANGATGTMFHNHYKDTGWTVEVLEKSPEAPKQCVIELKENLNEFDVNQMQNIVDINKQADVVLRTPEGITFSFAKGTMHMVEGKDSYPLGGVVIVAKFGESGIKNKNVTSDTFVCRINFEYSGELPGTATISIPVDNKWNGKTLYYYQVMEDGSLKDTGMSGKVEDGIFDVLQSHCSDYVLLTQSPKELGVTENTDDDNTGNGNNQSGNGNTQGSSGNSNTQVKPADTTKASPKTGDNHMFLLFVVLCVGSCAVGVSTLKARRRTR